jgi:beta-glucanase (GH16 family)/regulation of enolase protein 1 (concanavalin A-like superfamily)/plastocyanin
MKKPISAALPKLLAATYLLLNLPLFAGYHLTFNDEFNSYNSTRWTTADFWGMRNNGGDFQGQWFCDPNYAPSGFTAYNPFISSGSGTLTIQARPTPAGKYSYGLPYVSGQLTTAHRHTQRYGYYELRAKLPPGKGLWPRFWLLTDDGVWPGEYDIFEVLGKENPVTVHQTTHYRDASSSHGVDGFTYTGIVPTDGNFHTYGFLWTPETVTWYVDGVATYTQANRINIPMYALIDLTVGNDPNNWWPGNPDATTPWPANMELEYFRVYSNDSSIPSVTPDAGYSPSVIPGGNTVEVTPTTTVVPAGWAAGPVGNPELPGSSAWNANTGEWMVKGAGYGIGGYGEFFQYASSPLSGNGGIVATVNNVTAISSNSVNAGVMIRETATTNSSHISLLYNSNSTSSPTTGSLLLMSRTGTGALATTLTTVPNINTPVTLRISRNGNTFTAAYSVDDGLTWITVGTPQTIAMGNTVRAGLAVGGNQNNYLRLSRAIFSNVAVGPFTPLITTPANSIVTGQTLACSASLIDPSTGNTSATGAIAWSVASGGGTIDSNGVYTAPALVGTGTAIIKAVFGSNSVTKTLKVTLPSPWTFPIMIKTPPGNAGAVSGAWTVVGGGTGVSTTASDDFFQFMRSPINGNQTITVRVDSSNGPQAGLIMRDSIVASDTAPNVKSRYAGIWRTPTGLQWATRETTGGAAASRTTFNTTTLPIWLRLTRSAGSGGAFTFTASYSTNGSSWTQLGSSRSFVMDSSALCGLAVASGSATTTSTATFSNLSTSGGSPTVATPAAATAVSGSTTNLSVLGADDAGEANLSYTWAASGPAAVTYSANGTNASKNTTATFTRSGTYTFTATITDAASLTASSSATVVVNAVLSSIAISPASATVSVNATQQFTASGIDQFGQTVTASPTWSVTSGGGTINSAGLYTAPASVGTGSGEVSAVVGALSATRTVTITSSGSSLPSPWTALDINATPAGSTTYTGGQWTVAGGGATGTSTAGSGINGSRYSDAFRFVNQQVTGDGTLIVKLISPGTAAQAGLMIRDTTDKSSRYTSLIYSTQYSPSGLAWMTRHNNPETYSVLHALNVSVSFPVWLRLVRVGNTFTAFHSSDGTTWTQVSSAKTFPLNASPLVGLAVSSSNKNSTSTATFSDLSFTPAPNTPPTVATPTTATPVPVNGTTASLSVVGNDNGGEPALTYTWTATGPAAVSYNASGTNGAKNTTATFTKAGTYAITSTISDASGLTTTSTVNVTVNQTQTSITATPATASVISAGTQQFSATCLDQFGSAMADQPVFTWALASGIGSINSSGLYTAPFSGGNAVVRATSGSLSNTANVSVTNTPPSIATAATVATSPVITTTANCSILGNDDAGESSLSYSWTANGPAAVTFSENNSNAAKNTTATFTRAGSYTFTATINDGGSLSTTSDVVVIVNQALTNINISPTTPAVVINQTQQFTANGLDQFGQAMAISPTWNVISGSGTINSTGLYTAPATVGTGSAVVRAVVGTVSGTRSVSITSSSTSLPSPWTALDVNAAPAGSTTYTGSDWAVTGGGSAGDQWGLSGTGINGYKYSDSFRFVNQQVSGNGTLVVRLIDPGTAAQAGLMIRETTHKSSLYTSLIYSTQYAPTGLEWMSRNSTGGYTLLHNPSITVSSPVWLRLVRAGNTFTASRSSNGTTWTPIGTQTLSLNTTVLVGLAVSSGSATSTSTATFSDLSFIPAAPTVAVAAAATPSPVTGTTAILSVLGSDDTGEAGLTYAWSATGPSTVTYSANNTNAAKNTTATFTQAGTYTFTTTISDGAGLTTSSTVNVIVNQTLASIVTTPATANVVSGGSRQFAASGFDQFGSAMITPPTYDWSIVSGAGTTSNSGLFSAAHAAGDTVISAASGTVNNTAAITVVNAAPTVATGATATPGLVTGTTAALSVLGADDAGETNLNYLWTTTGTPPAAVTFSSNDNNAAKDNIVIFTKAGTYNLQVTITDQGGMAITSDVSVTVLQTLNHLSISPTTASLIIGATQAFTPTGLDQFSQPMACSLAFSVDGGGTVNSSGVFTATTAGPSYTLTANSGATDSTASIRVNSLFGSWMDAYPSLTESEKAAEADPDNDGVCNLLEFALGGVPDNAANRGYQMATFEDTNANGQQEFTLTLAVRNAGGSPSFSPGAGNVQTTVADGVKYTVQGSGDLNFPNSAVSETPAPTGLPPLPSGYEYRRFRLNDSEGLSAKGFLRVQIELNP